MKEVKEVSRGKFWASVFTLTGTIIGAGILGLPYVFSRAGFWIGFFWLVFLGLICMYVFLCIGEVVLRTKQVHQLTGYAAKYLGKNGKKLMFAAIIFEVYSALIAYLIGEGESFSHLFTGTVEYAVYFGIGFWLIMTLLLREGLKGLKRVETFGVSVILVLIVAISVYFSPGINMQNISYTNTSMFFIPFGVVLFAMLGFASVPEMRREINGKEKLLKKAIIIGVLIPIIVYAIFTFIFVGVLGQSVPEVATIAFGKLVTLLGIFTMMTSYFVLSFVLKDAFVFDFNYNKRFVFLCVSIIPLLLYLIITYFNIADFVKVLGIGGVISGGLTGILILVMALKAKKLGERKPEYKIPINWFIIGLLSLIFIIGVVVELFF